MKLALRDVYTSYLRGTFLVRLEVFTFLRSCLGGNNLMDMHLKLEAHVLILTCLKCKQIDWV